METAFFCGAAYMKRICVVLHAWVHAAESMCQCGRGKTLLRSTGHLQGGPRELVADVVSFSSTGSTTGQDLVYLSKVRLHAVHFVNFAIAARTSAPLTPRLH